MSGEAPDAKLVGKRVLAVDDDEVGLNIVQRMAEAFGMKVDGTKDPLDVSSMMERAHKTGNGYDVVALDHNIPGVDGLTIATNIRDDDRYA